MERKHWTVRLVTGLALGIACIIPGISGSLMAMSMGLYQPILSALTGFHKDVRGNARFLLPLVLGGGIGVLLIARALSSLAAHAQNEITVLFTGLVLGGIPELWKNATNPGGGKAVKSRLARAGLFAAGLAFVFAFSLLDRVFSPNGAALRFDGLAAALGGGISALALIVPGISSSFLLLYLGIYQPMMDAIASVRLRPLLFAAAGAVIVAAAIVKLTEWLFRKHTSASTFVVLGIVAASVAMIFDGPAFMARWPIHAALLAAGIGLAFLAARAFGGERFAKAE